MRSSEMRKMLYKKWEECSIRNFEINTWKGVKNILVHSKLRLLCNYKNNGPIPKLVVSKQCRQHQPYFFNTTTIPDGKEQKTFWNIL